jgi:hypothetical protein
MSISQKFIPPDIAREELTPRELELLAVLEQLTDMVNRQQERLQALELGRDYPAPLKTLRC